MFHKFAVLLMTLPCVFALSQLKILHSHGNDGNPECLTTCSGTTTRNSDTFTQVNFAGVDSFDSSWKFSKATVDISGCNFIKPPIITVSTDFNDQEINSMNRQEFSAVVALTGGGNMVADATATSFVTYVTGFHSMKRSEDRFQLSNYFANKYLDIHWIANGYLC